MRTLNLSRSNSRPDTDLIIYREPQTLLATDVALRRLHGDVAKQELYLLQLSSGVVAEPGTGPSQVVWCKPWQTHRRSKLLYHVPDNFLRNAIAPQ
jgi:hypothetical protein